MRKSRKSRKKDVILLLFSVAFLLINSINISYSPYDYDEGVYLFYGKYIKEGFVPYKDFFCHQPPLFFLFLSFLEFISNNVSFIRISMLFLILLNALLVFLISKKLGVKTPLIPFLFVLFSYSLIHVEKQILLESFMSLFILLSILSVITKKSIVFSISLPLSILTKFISLPISMIILLYSFIKRVINRNHIAVIIWFLTLPLIAFGTHWFKFIENSRRFYESGFFQQKVSLFLPEILFGEKFNLSIFLDLVKNFDFLFLFVLSFISIFFANKNRDIVFLYIIWFVQPILNIFVWPFGWDHYYLLFLFVSSILSGYTLSQIFDISKYSRYFVFLLMTLYLCIGITHQIKMTEPVDNRIEIAKSVKNFLNSEELFTFEILMNYLTDTKPVCNITEIITQLAVEKDFENKLLLCLKTRNYPVLESSTFYVFAPEKLKNYIENNYKEVYTERELPLFGPYSSQRLLLPIR